jgi:RNA polymerase sigma-70 factor, ECF subfamily
VNRSTEVAELGDRPLPLAGADAGRSLAFQRLVDEHLDRAYGLARAILRDSTEAEDATHDAFVRAWRGWPSLRDPARFQAWFDRIVINTCRTRMRRQHRRPTDISDEIVIASGDPFGHTEDRDMIEAAIADLSPDHRIVVALRFYRDLPIEAIAARLGIPAGTVRSRLHYALRQLHDAIDAPVAKGSNR